MTWRCPIYRRVSVALGRSVFYNELRKEFSSLQGTVIDIHAGKRYIEYGLEKGLSDAGAIVRRPLARVVGIGTQCKWYRNQLAVVSRE